MQNKRANLFISLAYGQHLISNKSTSLDNHSKSIHRLSAQLLGRNQKTPLQYATPEQLHILFDTFLHKKRLDIISSLPTPKSPSTVIAYDYSFCEFILPSLSDISSLLEATHSCSLIDPLSLAIQVTNPITILIKPIIYHSLTTGSVPNDMKLATITPIFKKSNSNYPSVANYRHICNLST